MPDDAAKNACPDEVADAGLIILRDAIRSIRLAGYNNDADLCAMEAVHIHTLPTLLAHVHRVSLEIYLDVRVKRYIHDYHERFGKVPTAYLTQWHRLAAYLASTEQEPETEWRQAVVEFKRLEEDLEYRKSLETMPEETLNR